MKNENRLKNINNKSLQENLDPELFSLEDKQISESLPYTKKEKNLSSNSLDFDIISEEDIKNYSKSLYAKKKNYKTDIKFQNNYNDKLTEITNAPGNQNFEDEQGSENDEETASTINILKESILLETKQKSEAGIWNSFTSKFSNLKNYLKYNVISTNKQLKFSELSYISLFEKSFAQIEFSSAEFNLAISKIFSFTYRTHFSELIPKDGVSFTSDCGWGCMIRAAQMMLSKAVLEHKLFQLGKEVLLSQEEIFDLKINVLTLFFDSLISFQEKEFLDKKDFAFFFKNYTKILNEEEKKFNELYAIKFNFSEEIFCEEDFQNKISQNGLTVKGVFAPFSIQNFTKLGILYDAGPGVWFSDAKAVKIFKEIEEQLNVFNNELHIFSFDSGVIYEKDLIEECFEEVKLECIKNFEECEKYVFNLRQSNDKKIKRDEYGSEEDIEKHNFNNINNNNDNINEIYDNNNNYKNNEGLKFQIKNKNENKEENYNCDRYTGKFNQNNEIEANNIFNNIKINEKKSNQNAKEILQSRAISSEYDNDKFDEGVTANFPFENNNHSKKINSSENSKQKSCDFIYENICNKCLAKLQQNNMKAFSSEILEIDFFNNESENETKSNYFSTNHTNNLINDANNHLDNNDLKKNSEKNIYENQKKTIRKFYKLKKSGFIFISVRHGLHSIEKEYHRSIKQYFKIPYNLGIIGGKANSAFYFVGEHQERLIYLDPHLSQKSIENLYLLYQNGYETYEPKYFYYLDIKNMSPGFTMGFYFRSVEDYKYLKSALIVHSDFKFNLFSFEKLGEKKKINKKNSVKKPEEMKFTEVIEDDFSVIDIEDDEF